MNRKAYIWLGLIMALAGACPAEAAEKPVQVRLSVAGGYDNNTGLNSKRVADELVQESVSVRYKALLNAKNQLKLSYSALNVNYFEQTEQDILSNQAGVTWSHLLSPSTIWENDYSFQYLDFMNFTAVTSYNHDVRSGVIQKINKKTTLRAGMGWSHRQYEDKKIRAGSGVLSEDDNRTDDRYAVDAQLSYKWNANLILQGGSVYQWNESDDLYNDYYDYEALRLFLGFSWLIAPRWTSSFRYTYELRDYNARRLTDDASRVQSDDTHTVNASLFYQINSQLSLGSTYTYREKVSNQPSMEYSGSLGTLGLYYSF